jgi:hypothetical protein
MADDTKSQNSDDTISITPDDLKGADSIPVPIVGAAQDDVSPKSDQSISINQDTVGQSEKGIGITPQPEAPLPPQETNGPANLKGVDKLEEEIEVLTGEIQALEAKIEGLTGGVTSQTPAPEPVKTDAPENLPVMSEPTPAEPEDKGSSMTVPPRTEPAPEEKKEVPVVNEIKPQPPVNRPVMAGPLDDIYSKVGQQPNEVSIKSEQEIEEGVKEAEHSDMGIGVLAEAVSIFGVIILVILLASPLYREALGQDLYSAVRSVGWLTAIISTTLGFLLSFFAKGRIWLVLITGLLFIVTAFFFIGVVYPTWFGSFSTTLNPLLRFYR